MNSLNTTPLHARRPGWMETRIDTVYAQAASGADRAHEQQRYKFGIEGRNSYLLTADDVVSSVSAANSYRSLSVLDVAAGASAFAVRMIKRGHVVHAVDARDPQTNRNYLFPDHADAYLLGNVERLQQVEGLLPVYDVVVSHNALHHLADPIGTLEQMAGRVAANGALFVSDAFALDGNHRMPFASPPEYTGGLTGQDVVEAMQANGFSLELLDDYDTAYPVDGTGLPATYWHRSGDIGHVVFDTVAYAPEDPGTASPYVQV
jgi:2-polyprenyl-3-methyl-5-hydroxy-6-metoxy-1,4-benzoquinol methylase